LQKSQQQVFGESLQSLAVQYRQGKPDATLSEVQDYAKDNGISLSGTPWNQKYHSVNGAAAA